MINISKETHFILYRDYKKCHEFLNSIKDENYSYPEEITNFHVYTEVRNEKELECIKSYFATQNLKNTKLILWSDYSIENLDCLKPFKEYITFKIYNPLEEAKGTILENEVNKLLAKDGKHYLQSDLLRILACHKYGGVWIDMDIILLRDFKPLLDQEYMYQWGSEIEYEKEGACATVLSCLKNSKFSNDLMKEILNMPIIYGSTVWGKDMFAQLYRKSKFNILPSPFFNSEWLISITDKELSEKISDMWFEKECPDELLFLDSFAWHWHNTSYKHKPIVKNSKFDKLRSITNKKLKLRGFDI